MTIFCIKRKKNQADFLIMDGEALNTCLNCTCPNYKAELQDAKPNEEVPGHELCFEIVKHVMFAHVLQIKCECGWKREKYVHTSKKSTPGM